MAHIHEKIDFTASVFIVHEGKVLLHLHKKLQKWLQPGGHIELDEDPNEAAVREAKEETGLDIALVGNEQLPVLRGEPSDIVPPKFLNRHRFNEVHEHIDLTYFGRVVGGADGGGRWCRYPMVFETRNRRQCDRITSRDACLCARRTS